MILMFGDLLSLGVVIFFGFITHGTLDTAGTRVLPNLIPVVVSWLIFLPPFKAFDLEITREWKQLWRPFWAMVLAGPFAALLRGVWLNHAIVPLFVVVFGGICALSLLAWRFLFWFFWARKS